MAVKNNDPTIDVIIPTYNGLPYLKETVQSVLDQTYKNFELYIIDDGSTDKTKAFVQSLKDKRVHYHKKKNGGQSTARNVGITISHSPFITFLDADDLWYPQKLEKQMAIMKKNPRVGLVYGHQYNIDENGIILGNLRIWKRGKIFNDLCGGNFIAGSASMVLIRREVINDVGVFKEDFMIGEDWELWLRIAKKYEIDFVPEIIAALRQRTDGMQQNRKKMADGLTYNFECMRRELGLTKPQEKTIAAYCLYNAAVDYMAIGRRDLARKALLKLFMLTPRQALHFDHWKLHMTFGMYTRSVLGNPVTDLLHYIYMRIRSAIGSVLRFLYHLVRPIKPSENQ